MLLHVVTRCQVIQPDVFVNVRVLFAASVGIVSPLSNNNAATDTQNTLTGLNSCTQSSLCAMIT